MTKRNPASQSQLLTPILHLSLNEMQLWKLLQTKLVVGTCHIFYDLTLLQPQLQNTHGHDDDDMILKADNGIVSFSRNKSNP